MSRDRPTSIGIIKFNARNNSVCSSPSSCTASSRRVDTLSVGAESAINQQRFVELCANDHDTDDGDGENALISAPVSEADECGSVADECCENLVQTCGVVVSPPDVPIEEVIKSVKLAHPPIPSDGVGSPQKRANEEKTPLTEIPGRLQKFWHKFLGIFHHYRTLPFRRLRLLSVAFLLVAFFLLPYFFAGLLTGVYLSLLVFLFCCVSEPLTPSQRGRRDQQRLTSIEQLDHVGFECQGQQIEPRPQNDDANENPQQQRNNTGSSTGRIYKGWMNILSEHYHPHTFHVNSIQTVLVRLDGHILRISRPERTMLKHCFHVDPTLTEPEPRMISQKIYDLTDAQVLLRPRRLARRRWFSRKYPICLKLAPTNLGIGTGDVIAKIAASGMMKRCHSLRQQQSEQGLTETYQHHMQQQRGIEWGESDDSDRADSAGDSVESESTDDEMSFCHRRPSCCAERPQQLLSTSPPPQPVLSASCPTPAATVSAAGDGRCLATTTLDPVQRRRRRRRTVPPRDNENDDDNSNSFGTLTMAKPKLQQQQRRPRCPSSAYIFLFARSAREKERWFHQLRQATLHQPNVGANDYFPAHFSTKIVHRCTSVPSLERLAAKLSDERVAYTLQNAQFSQQLASMIADLGCAAAAGTPSLPSCAVGGDAGGQQCVDGTADANSGGGGIVRMDLGWTANRSSNSNTTTKSNNGQQQQKQKQSVETEAEAHLAEMKQQHSNEFILLVNLIASRVFYDFCRDAYWCGAVRNKIQTKLATIHLPYFIETLELSKLDLGTTTPQIVKVHSPTVNEWGIWCDFDIKYDGIIRLVLETRVNLMKLKNVSESSTTATTPTASSCPTIIGADTNANSHNNDTLTEQRGATQQRQRHSCGGCCAAGSGQTTTTTALPTAKTTPSLPLSSCTTYRIAPNRYSDEEIPESPETSPDEEFGSKLKPDDHHWLGSTSGATTRRMKTGQKLISWVDRIAHSKYFREASELKLIRKMMEEISSMRLLLNVQVTTLEGRMCCNLPPPPSDRLWYAFRTPPRMSVKAVPQVGDRSVELSLVSEWIENKLQLILEKNLVLPNMDDVIVPVCSGNKLLQGNLNK